ncbi:MAG: hypothetical protein Pg6C_19070 [Treponemataceae bacterium]|nr:MAG: hypothetical protein Pg6C_18640 [Treponemataceae bacterium]GMO53014.1 MAG: hypothetical protein Pg6C_19070 [Treponemataceae bacterium]
MFGTYLRQSAGVLPWLLIPIACCVLFALGLDPYYVQEYGTAERVVGGLWGERASQSAYVTLAIALAVNTNLLLVIPCAIGGADGSVKHFQFFLGFFTSIALSFVIPLYFKMAYGLDAGTFGILIALDLFSFLVTFIVGSRFVSAAYRRAFWFTYYG